MTLAYRNAVRKLVRRSSTEVPPTAQWAARAGGERDAPARAGWLVELSRLECIEWRKDTTAINAFVTISTLDRSKSRCSIRCPCRHFYVINVHSSLIAAAGDRLHPEVSDECFGLRCRWDDRIVPRTMVESGALEDKNMLSSQDSNDYPTRGHFVGCRRSAFATIINLAPPLTPQE